MAQISKQYFGFQTTQRMNANALKMFAFYARAKDVRTWTGIWNVAESKTGIQRILIPSRAKAIQRYLKSDTTNIIPGCILIAFAPGVATIESVEEKLGRDQDLNSTQNIADRSCDAAILKFSFDDTVAQKDRPAMLVDGQHRLVGINGYVDEDLPVLIVALIGADLQEQAFNFVVINNKSTRVPTNDVKSIIANINEEQLQTRLLDAGVRYGDKSPLLKDINDLDDSPFKNILDWNYNQDSTGDKVVPVTAIEQCIRYVKTYFGDALGPASGEDDDDTAVQFFIAIWNGIKENYPSLWGRNESKLMKKVSLLAINEFVIERIKALWHEDIIDIYNLSQVQEYSNKIIKPIPHQYWEDKWQILIQGNSNIRKLIKEDLYKIVSNKKMNQPWQKSLEAIEFSE